MAEADRLSQIEAEIERRRLAEVEAEIARRQPPPAQPSRLRQAANLGTEFISSFNRPVANLVDTLLPGTPLSDRVGQRGDFAGQGKLTNAVSMAGEFSGMAVPSGMASRGALRIYDSLVKTVPAGARAGMAERLFRFFGQSTLSDDLIAGSISGAGASVGGDIAAENLGEEFRAGGEITGGVLTPMPMGMVYNLAKNLTSASQRLLNQATPSIIQLRGARKAQYGLLKAAGVKGNVEARRELVDKVVGFAEELNINYKRSTSTIGTQIRKLEKAAKEDNLTYSLLYEVAGELKGVAKRRDDIVGQNSGSLANILEDFAGSMPVTDDARRLLGDKTVAEVKRTADDLYNREKTYHAIELAIKNATEAEKGSFTNKSYIDELERQLKRLAKPEPKTGQGVYLTDGQRKLIRDIYTPGPLQKKLNAMRIVGYSSDDFVRTSLMFGVPSTIALASVDPRAAATSGIATAAIAGGALTRKALNWASGQMLQRNTEMAKDMLRAGTDANKIVRAYMKNAKVRKHEDLARLLITKNIDTAGLSNSPLVRRSRFVSDAVLMANIGNRLLLEGQSTGPNGDIPPVPPAQQ